jgi:hypothetical protein
LQVCSQVRRFGGIAKDPRLQTVIVSDTIRIHVLGHRFPDVVAYKCIVCGKAAGE